MFLFEHAIPSCLNFAAMMEWFVPADVVWVTHIKAVNLWGNGSGCYCSGSVDRQKSVDLLLLSFRCLWLSSSKWNWLSWKAPHTVWQDGWKGIERHWRSYANINSSSRKENKACTFNTCEANSEQKMKRTYFWAIAPAWQPPIVISMIVTLTSSCDTSLSILSILVSATAA